MTNTKTGSVVGGAVAVAAGVAVLSAAGYLLFGPQGKKNRKVVRGWTLKAKGELLERLEGMENVTAEEYHKAVAEVMKKYSALKNIAPAEIKKITDEFNKSWKAIIATHGPKKAAKKMAKKSKR